MYRLNKRIRQNNEDVVAMKELPIIHAWVWPTGKKLPFFFKIFKNWPIKRTKRQSFAVELPFKNR